MTDDHKTICRLLGLAIAPTSNMLVSFPSWLLKSVAKDSSFELTQAIELELIVRELQKEVSPY